MTALAFALLADLSDTDLDRLAAVETGLITIVCTRSRYGDQDREWSMRVGGVWELPEATTEAPDARAARKRAEAREAFRLACVAALQEHRPQGRGTLIDAARKRGIRGRNAKLRGWLAELAADPTSGLEGNPDGYDLRGGPDCRGQVGATPLGHPWPRPRGPGRARGVDDLVCPHPDLHRGQWEPHPVTGRLVCLICHPPPTQGAPTHDHH